MQPDRPPAEHLGLEADLVAARTMPTASGG